MSNCPPRIILPIQTPKVLAWRLLHMWRSAECCSIVIYNHNISHIAKTPLGKFKHEKPRAPIVEEVKANISLLNSDGLSKTSYHFVIRHSYKHTLSSNYHVLSRLFCLCRRQFPI